MQKKFLEPIEKTIFEKLRRDNIEDHNEVLVPHFDFLQIEEFKDLGQVGTSEKESAIILIHWIGTLINTCFFPQTRRCALEMLLVIGKASSFETRLQFILPYVLKMFEDK